MVGLRLNATSQSLEHDTGMLNAECSFCGTPTMDPKSDINSGTYCVTRIFKIKKIPTSCDDIM